MIPSRAIKVYQSMGSQPEPEFITTVFTPYDAHKTRDRLFLSTGVHRVIFKSVRGTVLETHHNSINSYGAKK